MTFPVALYHPDSKKCDKVIHARDQEELDRLLAIGWKVK